jgi:hypothetical protein
MWDEIRLAASQSRIEFPDPSATERRISDANYVQGISTNEAMKFQGIHGRQILIIADEAPGIRADIWEAIEGVRAGGDVHVLMLGNPLIPSGYYFNAFAFGDPVWGDAVGQNGDREQGRREEARAGVTRSRRGTGHGILQDCAARADARFQ